jgi:tRNA(Ile)-lysidine synthase
MSSPAPCRGAPVAPGADFAGELLARCRFPDPGEGEVALAVSGGADSLALMVLAARAGLDCTAIHVDHGLRPGSGEEASVVAGAARRLGFGFVAVEVVVGDGPDLEARARRARYAALPAGVLTGHTMDDQAETVLLNLLRGAGLDGLAAMAAFPARRPLLGLRRAETAALCAAEGLEPVRDPSNLDRRFRRNRVRLEVIPLLCSVAQRDVVPLLARAAEVASLDAAYLDSLAAGVDPTDARSLAAAPAALARRAVRGWLRAGGDAERHPPSLAEVERVLEVARGARRACELAGGRRVWRSAGRLSCGEKP